jgi:ABC-type dipeptide/oligopeptide/nickel transport system permease subunit
MTMPGEHRKDFLWLLLWLGGLFAVAAWLLMFLNEPARLRVQTAFFNTMLGAVIVVVSALLLGWSAAMALLAFERNGSRGPYLTMTFGLNLLRSVPQMVGMLVGYAVVTALILGGSLPSPFEQILFTSLVTSLFVFQEVVDLIRERVRHFEQLDFVNALLVCGVAPRVIINREILLKNSLSYLIQKSVSLFGRAIFLICSIDFIISVGLSTEVSLVNLPTTLGSMLANLDSKQDVLVIGSVVSDPGLFPTLFFEHLQGISVAFLIVYSLLCIHRIAGGMTERYRL